MCDHANAKMDGQAKKKSQIPTGNFFKMKTFKMKNAVF